ncbi:carotenoid oxygenase family protein [Alteraurantiacibacter aestuarii]|uniref:Dioxygenase n=1 Tax=Alteraurantiacibacter aestuarii TaxID=650004 RepID=A0A844ZHK0_9SPHN|nr:carotenoid oxygenase family protein [Alteraurantiacibacter aestuarii]MXO87258.1 lignostilbene alpha-beta-dioxygenase [Alteraurantiacibacter aestuarii]
MSDIIKGPQLDRRGFMGATTLGTGAALIGLGAGSTALAQEAPSAAPQVDFPDERGAFGGGGSAAGAVNRTEMDLFDCEVEGHLPTDLDGVFYRVGPDPQYPKSPEYAGDIPFDGEGHVSMFRINNGHVDYRTRYARNARWKAQHAARRSLFGMYRNPSTDDPSVAGLNRGTANTQLFLHHGKLLVFKEDSPPVYMDPLTLDTMDEEYTFGGKLESQTHTAHPKVDPMTGGLIGFGYEATGFLSKDINVYEADRAGNIFWSVTVAAPYAGMMHDFCVTQDYIVLYLTNMAADAAQIAAGGVHFRYDSSLPTYLGVMRRGGDGRDLKWFTGPNLFCTHVMGGWNEGTKITVDWDGGEGNQFPFFPSLHEPWDPVKGTGYIRRFTVDVGSRTNDRFQSETIFPEIQGVLSRQDDRFHTLPYRWGYLQVTGPNGGWALIDHREGTSKIASVAGYSLSEMTFVPRSKNAEEGDGYLIGLGSSMAEAGRSDLMLFDTSDVDAGPVARVKMPFRCVGQVHGFWADASDIPGANAA